MGKERKERKRQTARRSTGGKAPRKSLFPEKIPPTPEYLFWLRYKNGSDRELSEANTEESTEINKGTQSYPSVSDVQIQNAAETRDNATQTPIGNLPPCCKCCCAKSESEVSEDEI